MDAETMLWYEKPAENFDQALPIGNGRIGAMVFGGAADEVLKLNEDSVWSGGKRNRNNASPRRKRSLSKNYRAGHPILGTICRWVT